MTNQVDLAQPQHAAQLADLTRLVHDGIAAGWPTAIAVALEGYGDDARAFRKPRCDADPAERGAGNAVDQHGDGTIGALAPDAIRQLVAGHIERLDGTEAIDGHAPPPARFQLFALLFDRLTRSARESAASLLRSAS